MGSRTIDSMSDSQVAIERVRGERGGGEEGSDDIFDGHGGNGKLLYELLYYLFYHI